MDARVSMFRSLTGHAATRRRFDAIELARLAQRLSVEDAVMSLSKLAWLVDNEMAVANGQLLGWLRPGDRVRVQRLMRSHVLLFPARVGAAMRVALLHADRRPAENLDENGTRALAMLILGVVDADPGHSPEALGRDDPAALLRRTSLQQLAARSRPPPAHQIARMRRLFVELPGLLGDPLGISTAFEEETGIPLDRYLAIAFAITSRWMSWDKQPEHWPLEHSYFAATRVGVSDFERVLADVAATPDQLRSAFRKEASLGRDGLFDLAPFAKRPLCRMSDGRIVPLDPPMLLERLIGDGIYWRLKHLFTAAGQGSQYGSEVGRLLEAHLLEVARDTLASAPLTDVHGEVTYATRHGPVRGPDIAIWQDGQLVLAEVGATRCDYARVVLNADIAAYHRDVGRIFIAPKTGRVRQLDTKIRALRAGELKYPGVPADAPVHPVVCLLDGFPRGPLLTDDLDAAIDQAGLLRSPGTAPCSVVSASEFESLCALSADGQGTLSDLLGGWHATHHFRPFMSWVADSRPGSALRPKIVEEQLDRALDRWAGELGLLPGDQTLTGMA